MTREGSFVEAPAYEKTASEKMIDETMGPDQIGIRFVKVYHQSGLKRVFEFPIEKHPQINALNEMRDNARDHLVLDAFRLAESLRTPR